MWHRTTKQLDFLRDIWSSLDDTHQKLQGEVLQILHNKLHAALLKIGGLIDQRVKDSETLDNEKTVVKKAALEQDAIKIKRWKYAIYKESLDKTIRELEDWQQLFDPSWYLVVLKFSSLQIDSKLNKTDEQTLNHNRFSLQAVSSLRHTIQHGPESSAGIFLPPDGLNLAHRIDIHRSTVQLAQRKGTSRWLILEEIPYPVHADMHVFITDVRRLAQKLRDIKDPLIFGLLQCYGVVKHVQAETNKLSSMTFVLYAPDQFTEARSLRTALLSGERNHSLSERFRIAKDLARAVYYVQTFGFVHKNVRPETVLLLSKVEPDIEASLGAVFLAGLEDFRTAAGKTMRLSPSSWERDLYRHPLRQGERPQEDYIMQHDIYSLGVCLLEIGMWVSFVEYSDTGIGPSQSLARSILGHTQLTRLSTLKDEFVSLSRAELPKRMGTRYARVVETCLTCLDEDNVDFGDETEFQDEDGVLVSVRYIEKILFQLSEIHV